MSINDVRPADLIKKAAEELKKVIKAPDWSKFVKTGAHNERPPEDRNWWYIRAASVLRKVYLYGPTGINKLRTKYGGKKGRKYKPEEFRKSGGKILRTVLQQLEKLGYVKQVEKGVHKGRIITKEGKKFLDGLCK